jgi:hypothetical protein
MATKAVKFTDINGGTTYIAKQWITAIKPIISNPNQTVIIVGFGEYSDSYFVNEPLELVRLKYENEA